MSKKISSILFRIHKFNNYKNSWVFNYKPHRNNIILYYLIFSKIFNSNVLEFKLLYTSYFILYGKLYDKYHYNFNTKLFNTHNILNNILYINFYKLIKEFDSINFISYFVKINILKHIPIKQLYKKLYMHLIHKNLGIGVKIIISGCFNSTNLSSSEVFKFGTLPLNKIDIYIVYNNFFLITKYGVLGVKIWILKNV